MSAVRAKKARMNIVHTPGFVEISSSAGRKIVWYYARNFDNYNNYTEFLRSLESSLLALLKNSVRKNPIKFNLKLEGSYSRPHVENSLENRAFKTTAVEVFLETDIATVIQRAYSKLLDEEDVYKGRGSGFTLDSIDGVLLAVYKYTPMSGSSYIELPKFIDRKHATINTQNHDEQCFKWAVLARHASNPKYRIGENYRKVENKYNFEGISFPTPIININTFEKKNLNVSVNVYGLDKKFHPSCRYPKYEVYPLRVVDDEKDDHFDLLLVNDGSRSHYVYISDFSRLVSSQKTKHNGHLYICRRCFMSFDNQNLKYKLNGEDAIKQHKLICGGHKLILPKMPKEGECIKFDAWQNTVRHPVVIYADFESLLVKTDEQKGRNTRIINKHEAMSYGFLVKAGENVPLELLHEHDIPTGPVIYRGSEDRPNVAKHFMDSIVSISRKIEKLMMTNLTMNITDEEEKTHQECIECNLCKCSIVGIEKVRDHDHLTGKFRQSLCSKCNLTLQQPKFVPVFFHNLSNYDSHYIITQLGYDANTIKVIPNSEEKFISFSKYVSNKFTVRFIDTFRFMASSLGVLAANMITPKFDQFRETAKHFATDEMPLVTRKGVYPYEYTDSWGALNVTTLPRKRDFYSSLTESHITEDDFNHAKEASYQRYTCI